MATYTATRIVTGDTVTVTWVGHGFVRVVTASGERLTLLADRVRDIVRTPDTRTPCPKCTNNPGRYFFVIHRAWGECFPCGGTGYLPTATERAAAKAKAERSRETAKVRALVVAEAKTRPGANRVVFGEDRPSLVRRVLNALDVADMDAVAKAVETDGVASVVDAMAAI